jgi:uncharacterized protein YndB with AHSA1/START domain
MESLFTAKATVQIEAPATEVWEALTQPETIKKYFFGAEAISDWQEGGPIVFKGEWEGKTFENKGTILKIKPGKLFIYRYENPELMGQDPGEEQMTIIYELNPIDDRTELTILQENIKDENTKDQYERDWQKVLDNLKVLMEKDLASL